MGKRDQGGVVSVQSVPTASGWQSIPRCRPSSRSEIHFHGVKEGADNASSGEDVSLESLVKFVHQDKVTEREASRRQDHLDRGEIHFQVTRVGIL